MLAHILGYVCSRRSRRARVVLSLLAEPDDAMTGRLLQQRGAVETLRLLDSDAAVPGLSRVDAQVWRDPLSPQEVERLSERLRTVENGGFATLIPGDAEWPRALDDLGERAPYVLFVRGATSFLARPLEDLVTVTGARASTSYGERVASELAGDLAIRGAAVGRWWCVWGRGCSASWSAGC